MFSFIVELENARHELEGQETKLRKEADILKHQLTQTEHECQLAIKNHKVGFEENLGRLRKEKVSAVNPSLQSHMGYTPVWPGTLYPKTTLPTNTNTFRKDYIFLLPELSGLIPNF